VLESLLAAKSRVGMKQGLPWLDIPIDFFPKSLATGGDGSLLGIGLATLMRQPTVSHGKDRENVRFLHGFLLN